MTDAPPGPSNLASQDFWEEDYLQGVELPARPANSFTYERCMMRELERSAPAHPGASVIEIGCAPARWLVWYAERFGASVTGIEYTPFGAEMSRRNLDAAGIEGQVREGDFFSPAVEGGRFDIVLSLGFIEHFDDIDAAFARHLDFLAPGGTLALGVPNFRGLIGLLQRWADPAYLRLHNREAMRPELYRRLASAYGMEIIMLRYLDGIDPAMVRVSRHGPAEVLFALAIFRRLRATDRLNHRLISSYVLLTFKREDRPTGSAPG